MENAMKKIIILGCPGSGKTTFAKALAAKTGIPLFHLDAIWHKPDRSHITREEFDARLSEILGLDEYIIDGNYGRTIETRLASCDTVYLFDLPTEVCLEGVRSRIGKERSDMPWVEDELDPDFEKQITSFKDEELGKIYELLEKYSDGKRIAVFKSREEAERECEADEELEMRNPKCEIKEALKTLILNIKDKFSKKENKVKKEKEKRSMGKTVSIVALCLVGALLGSVLLQFGYNMLFLKPFAAETTKGGDGKLTDMLYESEFLDDSYFEDTALISANLEGAIERIDIREDCADFTACGLIRFYLENEHRLAEVNKAEIKKCLTGFKYWMDQYDGRTDSMCHWSENHQILFAVTEYLVGCEWSDAIFADGKCGEEHVDMAKERIEAWMSQRYYYGFNEYYSNNYYPEDIAPMANFIQFARAEDSAMVDRMKIVMDLIWIDIATQSYKYVDINGNTQYAFLSASGRMYMDNKSSDDTGNRLRPYINLVLENGEDYKTNSNRFFVCFRRMYEARVDGAPIYEIPEVIKEIFNDSTEIQIVKSSNGITIEELVADGFVGPEVDQIMMQMGMEAFSNAAVIDNSITYLRKNKLFGNEFLNDFKLVNLWPLTLTNSLGGASSLLNPSTNGKAIQRANVYTYQTPYYSMSTSQEHFAGDYADQHQISVATLGSDLSIYTAQPMRNSSRGQYWVGYGRLPYSVQDENVNISIYTIPEKTGMLEPHIVQYTHAYFPVGLFDEVITDYLDEGYIFGRKGESYIMLRAVSDGNGVLRFKNDMDGVSAEDLASDRSKIKDNVREMIEASGDLRYDLIFEGGASHAWITELGCSKDNGSFAEFVAEMRANKCEYKDMTVAYKSGDKSFDVKYNEHFKLNGEIVDTNYARYESDYVNGKVERGAEVIEFSFGGKTLTLNYKEGTREY